MRQMRDPCVAALTMTLARWGRSDFDKKMKNAEDRSRNVSAPLALAPRQEHNWAAAVVGDVMAGYTDAVASTQTVDLVLDPEVDGNCFAAEQSRIVVDSRSVVGCTAVVPESESDVAGSCSALGYWRVPGSESGSESAAGGSYRRPEPPAPIRSVFPEVGRMD